MSYSDFTDLQMETKPPETDLVKLFLATEELIAIRWDPKELTQTKFDEFQKAVKENADDVTSLSYIAVHALKFLHYLNQRNQSRQPAHD